MLLIQFISSLQHASLMQYANGQIWFGSIRNWETSIIRDTDFENKNRNGEKKAFRNELLQSSMGINTHKVNRLEIFFGQFSMDSFMIRVNGVSVVGNNLIDINIIECVKKALRLERSLWKLMKKKI